LKKFDMDAYIKRRIRELRGEKMYTSQPGDEVGRYIERRLRELRDCQDNGSTLDKSILGCYTVGTMGDDDGES